MDARAVNAALEPELDAELALVRNAILLVAAGAAPRVTVANLRHGREIEATALVIAESHDVRLRALPAADRRRIDLVAEECDPSAAAAPESDTDRPVPASQAALPGAPRAPRAA